ncbi:hypothetical protein AB4428_23600, partial [Vibrio lentus]
QRRRFKGKEFHNSPYQDRLTSNYSAGIEGECLGTASLYSSIYITTAPSEAAVVSLGYTDYMGWHKGVSPFDKPGVRFIKTYQNQASLWCNHLNSINYMGKSSWAPSTWQQLIDVYRHFGKAYNVLGWPTYRRYWTPVWTSRPLHGTSFKVISLEEGNDEYQPGTYDGFTSYSVTK